LARLDLDVRSGAAEAAAGLVQQKPGVGQADAVLALRGTEDQGSGAGHPAAANRVHLGLDETDRVVDGVARLDVAAL
jgi:hypothetical protein